MSCSPSTRAATSTSLNCLSVPGKFGFNQYRDCGSTRSEFAQQPKLLRPEIDEQAAHARRVASGSVQADDKTQSDRVVRGREYDRNRRRRRLGRPRFSFVRRCYYGHLTTNQVGRQCRQSIVLTFRPAILDGRVLALDIAGLLQALAERGHVRRISVRRCAVRRETRSPASPAAAHARRAANLLRRRGA